MSDYTVDANSRFPIKAWTKGVQVEDVAVEQLRNIAKRRSSEAATQACYSAPHSVDTLP